MHLKGFLLKAVVLFFFMSVGNLSNAFAQNAVNSVQLRSLYTEAKYSEILAIESVQENSLLSLYKGKSFYALDRCSEALPELYLASTSIEKEISEDALWTQILCWIQLRDLNQATRKLFDAQSSFSLARYRSSSVSLKRDLIRFLSEKQLLELSRTLSDPDHLFELYNQGEFTTESLIANQLRLSLTRFGVDSLKIYSVSKPVITQTTRTPPEGFVYRIGVLLPINQDPVSIESQNSRALYNGLLLAIDELNDKDERFQIHIRMMNSSFAEENADSLLSVLWMDNPVDVIIGPLFSSRAAVLTQNTAQYGIPIVLPLANSDQLIQPGVPTVQLNPVFSVHGREMARFAVQSLKLDTVSVISDRNSLGYAAAIAFKEEAERLGALIPTFFAGDMANTGYDIRPFTQTLYTDSVMIDSLGITPAKAVYAPFTGAGAQTLIRLLMTDLSAKQNPLTILGLEEWNNDDLVELRVDSSRIYYSSPFLQEPDSIATTNFIQNYERRFGEEPNVLAQTGYDAGSFIGELLLQSGNPIDYRLTLKNPPAYQGLRQNYVVRNYLNQSVYIFTLFD